MTRRGAAHGLAANLLLAGLGAAAAVAAPTRDGGGVPALQADPLSLLPASGGAWSVSRSAAGCYLLSPQQKGSSSLAVGFRSQREAGLFLVGFAMSVQAGNATEPVRIITGLHALREAGRMIGFRLFFVPLSEAEMGWVVQELHDSGTLWLEVKHTWIAHGGRGLRAALASYAQDCAGGDVGTE